MAWYLYAVTGNDGPSGPPVGLRGIDDAEVGIRGEGHLRLVVSPLDGELAALEQTDPAAAVAAVRQHDAVLTTLAADVPVLPVRFGTVLPDDAAAEQLLADPDGELADALAAVAGADEWVVRVDAIDDPEGTPPEEVETLTPGHAFFARKRSRTQARADARSRALGVAEVLARRLEDLARGSRALPPREPETVARTAYLVDRASADSFLLAASGANGAAVGVQGPLPPYRFAGDPRP